jgi:Tol biopolymer transport system component
MNNIPIILILLSITFASAQEKYLFEGERRLKNIKMITLEGENAEAYFSFDGRKIIYQSTSGHFKCDQIFTMNLDGTDKKLVSTGKGRTTCAYFYPNGDKILYASTHHSDENCPTPPDKSKGYVWKLYDEFDIFMADADGSNVVQLTNSGKYDAEATISPLGDKIVFTSLRDGDPELYLMNLDGSEQKRLTFEKGYDGGAFFSADGSKIVFRASRPKSEQELADYDDLVNEGLVRPTNLEIFVIDADGSNLKQVTNLNAASFAPFFHPDGKRIIFSSNYGSKNRREFNLFLINVDGSGLEQITFNRTFDGFPMFSYDGKYLIFSSNRFNLNPNDTNIFIAEWIDQINQEKGN